MPSPTIRRARTTAAQDGSGNARVTNAMGKLTTSCSTLGYAMAGATIAAAAAAEEWIGRGDERAAEEAAANAMRAALNTIDFAGHVIVGEVDIPILNVGETVGTNQGRAADLRADARLAGDREELAVAPHRLRAPGELVAGDDGADRVVVVVHFEGAEVVGAEVGGAFGVELPANPTAETGGEVGRHEHTPGWARTRERAHGSGRGLDPGYAPAVGA